MSFPYAIDGLNGPLLLASILLPLVAGVLLLLSGKLAGLLARPLAVIGFAGPAAIALWLLYAYVNQQGLMGDYAFGYDVDTGLKAAFGISLKLGLNGISLPLYVLAAVVSLAAGLYAVGQQIERQPQYLTLLLFMSSGLLGTFATTDIFFFYIFHEFALIPTIVAIGIWGGKGRKSVAVELAIYLTLGALLTLVGLIALVQAAGLQTWDMRALRESLPGLLETSLSSPIAAESQRTIFGLLLFGFGILVSLFPFHSWAPRGYGAAPTSVAMLHAGVLKKFGLYGLIQVAAPLLPSGVSHWMPALLVLALGNVLVLGLATMAQRDLKQMIGYSSVMHMGTIFLGLVALSATGAGGAVLMMVAHGLSVSLLFLLANCIYQRTQTFDMDEMGGLAPKTPVLAMLFVAATMASIGLPGFASFWGEVTIFYALLASHGWVVALAALGIIISAIYGLRAVAKVFFGEESPSLAEHLDRSPVSDVKPAELLPALILLAGLLLIGISPRPISEPIAAAAEAEYPSEAVEGVSGHASVEPQR